MSASFAPTDTVPFRVVKLSLSIANPNPSDPITGFRVSETFPSCVSPLFYGGDAIEIAPEPCRAALGQVATTTTYPYEIQVGYSQAGATIPAGATCTLTMPFRVAPATPCTTTTGPASSDQGGAAAASASVSAPNRTRKSWSGATNYQMSIGSNWIGGTPPSDGQDILFDAPLMGPTVNNDLPPTQTFNAVLFIASFSHLGGYAYNLKAGVADNGGNAFVSPIKAILPLAFWSSFPQNTLALEDIDLNGHDVYFSGPGKIIVNGAVSGTGDAHVSGAGSLTVKGESTFDGTWRVAAGTLEAQAAQHAGLDVGAGGSVSGGSFGSTSLRDGGSLKVVYVDDLVVTGGKVRIAAFGPLSHGTLQAPGTVTLQGGTLALEFPAGPIPQGGSYADLVKSDTSVSGCFTEVVTNRPELLAMPACTGTAASADVVVNWVLVDGFE